ncbi:MAG: S24 family peptidase [Sphaerochaetaceae bacterium]|nr:S24 family peptidase [Sphaerochaetaceae bacterium]
MSGERLKQIRNAIGISQTQIAKELGLAQSTYAKYELGGAIPESVMCYLAEKGFNIHWLVTGDGPMFLDANTGSRRTISGQDSEQNFIPTTIHTPRGDVVVSKDDAMLYVPITEQRLSAGPGQEWGDDAYTGERVPVLKRLVSQYGKKLLASQVVGDSMEPTISNGDIAIYAKECVQGDGIYALSVQGDVLIKRVSFDKLSNKLTIISDNNKYPVRDVPANADGVMVLGKVISWVHVEE